MSLARCGRPVRSVKILYSFISKGKLWLRLRIRLTQALFLAVSLSEDEIQLSKVL